MGTPNFYLQIVLSVTKGKYRDRIIISFSQTDPYHKTATEGYLLEIKEEGGSFAICPSLVSGKAYNLSNSTSAYEYILDYSKKKDKEYYFRVKAVKEKI